MATVRATITVKGTRPLWWHWFGPDAIPLDKRQEKTGVPGNDPEEWRRSVLVTKDGQLYIEPTYVFGMVKDAAKYTKKGRVGSLQKPVAATLQVTDDRILVDRWLPSFPNGHVCDPKAVPVPPTDSEQPVYLDIRSVVNPSTRGRNVRYRVAAAPGWGLKFNLEWDSTIVSRSEMEAVIIDGGKLTGLGNGRTIGMGRFTVESFDVHDA